ncbi:hypothetical protein AC578_5516 [Pseudocercospora eumusae]|uniref:Uncharacterized protein n=1 Tax=Pseudocercospora eumusae TaxID=321146 RepID=A0A139H832_9PEZI|nr:hypothetical protein AC578_5516 [Pseudocercospora eumusae]
MQQRERAPPMQHTYQRSTDSTRSIASSTRHVPNHLRNQSSEQLPQAVPLISRDASGYFNMSSIQPRPYSPAAATPRTSTEQPRTPASMHSNPPRGSMHSNPHRGSTASEFKSGHERVESFYAQKRRDSSSTTATSDTKTSKSRGRSFVRRDSSTSSRAASQKRSGSRRASFKEAIRRASNDIGKSVDILRMGPADRNKWAQREKDKILRDVEEARRQNEATRPKYQQDYMAERQRQSMDNRNPSRPPPNNGQFSAADQINAIERALQDENDPNFAEALVDALRSAERTAGEDFAFFISKMIDPLKSKKPRQNSDDSDLSFADIGVEEELLACERCGRPVINRSGLKDGLCQRCYAIRLKGVQDWFDQPSSPAPESNNYDGSDSSWSASSHNSYLCRRSAVSKSFSNSGNHSNHSSPTRSRPVDEEQYMKIAVNRRIRKVRQTIYIDPGNPFESDEEEQNTQASSTKSQTSTNDHPTPLDQSLRNSTSSDERYIFGEPSMETPLLPHEIDAIPLPHFPSAPTHIRDSSFGPAIASPVPQRLATPDLLRSIPITLDLEDFPTLPKSQLTLAEALKLDREEERKKASIPLSLNPPTPPPKDFGFLSPAVYTPQPSSSPNEVVKNDEGEGGGEEGYVAPRTYWRRSLPSVTKGLNLLGVQQRDGDGKRRGSRDDIEVRNTRYYGFYDGLLEEYRTK